MSIWKNINISGFAVHVPRQIRITVLMIRNETIVKQGLQAYRKLHLAWKFSNLQSCNICYQKHCKGKQKKRNIEWKWSHHFLKQKSLECKYGVNHRTYCWIRFCYEAGFWSILYCTYQRNILGSEYCYICSSIHCDLQDKRALIRLIFSRSLCQTHFVHSHTNMVIFSWMSFCRSFIVCRSEGLWMVLQGRWQWQWFFLLCT